jgi:hypothetical protein
MAGLPAGALDQSKPSGRLGPSYDTVVEFHSFIDAPQRFDELITILGSSGYRMLVQTEACPPQPFAHIATGNDTDMQLNVFAYRP